ncbi:ATP-binding cassette domain-containing protein [Streptomyces prasinosporus]|uniref:ATP-binding cassette domain-containing protein n=1 Tax=Streptomyces prasinosporus TaxID=68256 RepID=UPI003CD0752C
MLAVEGPSGSGRTCLLLALTGRMRPTEGRAAVGGTRTAPAHGRPAPGQRARARHRA